MPQDRLKTSTVAWYSIADFPHGVTLIPVLILIQAHYATTIGVDIAVVGTILMAARLIDLFTDPLIGYLSDHTRTRWGRRKPWILVATPFLMLTIYKVFMPPEGVGASYLATWSILLWLAWTMFLIPYYAWGAELSPDYNERTKITGGRALVNLIGSCAAFIPPMVAYFGFGIGGTDTMLMIIGYTAIVTFPLCIGVALYKVPNPPASRSTNVSIPFSEGLRVMARNGPFKRLMLGFFVSQMGITTVTALAFFYMEAVIGRADDTIPLLALFFVCSVSSVPFWTWLSGRIGKHRAWATGLMVMCVSQPIYLFLGLGDLLLMIIPMTLGGIANGAFIALPNAMKADVIDIDSLKSGKDRAAVFFSVWAMTFKLAAALSLGGALVTLGYLGFDPRATIDQTGGAQALRVFYALVPPAFFAIAIRIIWNYPVTAARHQRLRDALERRRSRLANVAALAE